MKKGVEAAEKGTKKAVQTTYVCNDGKTDQATVKKNACKDDGGVRAEQTPRPKSNASSKRPMKVARIHVRRGRPYTAVSDHLHTLPECMFRRLRSTLRAGG